MKGTGCGKCEAIAERAKLEEDECKKKESEEKNILKSQGNKKKRTFKKN